jgi:energy-converting hydrogenase Eha subunit B
LLFLHPEFPPWCTLATVAFFLIGKINIGAIWALHNSIPLRLCQLISYNAIFCSINIGLIKLAGDLSLSGFVFATGLPL